MNSWLSDYKQCGYSFPHRVFSEAKTLQYRQELEALESQYQNDSATKKLAIGHANSLMPFVDEITRSAPVLEKVQDILGPNILVWNSSFFIKEPRTEDYISWHQDLTYWGLTDSHEVTAWVALTDVTVQNGCMKFVPGSHTGSIVEHRDTFNENNLLSRGQELAVDVNEEDAVNVVLKAGEMSLHHGQVFHGSNANQSNDRRIGLAIRYITPDMQQTITDKTDAKLVAGTDEFNHFNLTNPPKGLLDAEDIAAVKRDIAIKEQFLMAGVDRGRQA